MLYPKDPKVRVERHEKTLKIEWNWGSRGGYVWVAFGFIIYLVLIPFAQAPTMSGEPRGAPEIFGLATLLSFFAVPMILGGLTGALNKTVIHADHQRFTVRVGPFRWHKAKIVAGQEIQQFFVNSHVTSSSSVYGSLYLLDGQSHTVTLATLFPSRFAAHQICHELQDFYGLEDLPVFGQNTLPHQPGPRGQRNL